MVKLWGIILAGVLARTVSLNADTLLISYATGQVHAYTTSGHDLGVFASADLRNPMGMAIDRSGNTSICSYDNHTVVRYSPSGENLGVFVRSGLTNPAALVYDASGNLYVANTKGNNITKYAPSGTALGVFASSNLFFPRALTFAPNGNLLVANTVGGITRYAPSGQFLDTFSTAGLNAPVGMAFDGNTNLYVANEFGGSVQRITADGTSEVAFTGFGQPMDVKIDSGGHIWVLDAQGDNGGPNVFQFAQSGAPLASFAVDASIGANALIIQSNKPPLLKIAIETGHVVVSWATNATDFVLQQTTSLTSKTWINSASSDPQGLFRDSATNAARFFRLMQP